MDTIALSLINSAEKHIENEATGLRRLFAPDVLRFCCCFEEVGSTLYGRYRVEKHVASNEYKILYRARDNVTSMRIYMSALKSPVKVFRRDNGVIINTLGTEILIDDQLVSNIQDVCKKNTKINNIISIIKHAINIYSEYCIMLSLIKMSKLRIMWYCIILIEEIDEAFKTSGGGGISDLFDAADAYIGSAGIIAYPSNARYKYNGSMEMFDRMEDLEHIACYIKLIPEEQLRQYGISDKNLMLRCVAASLVLSLVASLTQDQYKLADNYIEHAFENAVSELDNDIRRLSMLSYKNITENIVVPCLPYTKHPRRELIIHGRLKYIYKEEDDIIYVHDIGKAEGSYVAMSMTCGNCEDIKIDCMCKMTCGSCEDIKIDCMCTNKCGLLDVIDGDDKYDIKFKNCTYAKIAIDMCMKCDKAVWNDMISPVPWLEQDNISIASTQDEDHAKQMFISARPAGEKITIMEAIAEGYEDADETTVILDKHDYELMYDVCKLGIKIESMMNSKNFLTVALLELPGEMVSMCLEAKRIALLAQGNPYSYWSRLWVVQETARASAVSLAKYTIDTNVVYAADSRIDCKIIYKTAQALSAMIVQIQHAETAEIRKADTGLHNIIGRLDDIARLIGILMSITPGKASIRNYVNNDDPYLMREGINQLIMHRMCANVRYVSNPSDVTEALKIALRAWDGSVKKVRQQILQLLTECKYVPTFSSRDGYKKNLMVIQSVLEDCTTGQHRVVLFENIARCRFGDRLERYLDSKDDDQLTGHEIHNINIGITRAVVSTKRVISINRSILPASTAEASTGVSNLDYVMITIESHNNKVITIPVNIDPRGKQLGKVTGVLLVAAMILVLCEGGTTVARCCNDDDHGRIIDLSVEGKDIDKETRIHTGKSVNNIEWIIDWPPEEEALGSAQSESYSSSE